MAKLQKTAEAATALSQKKKKKKSKSKKQTTEGKKRFLQILPTRLVMIIM